MSCNSKYTVYCNNIGNHDKGINYNFANIGISFKNH